MLKRALAMFAFVMVSVGVAFATHPGSSSGYAVLGFTADSKHVYFKKGLFSVMITEEWLAVYDATTGKQKTSQPTLRNCSPMDDKLDPDAKCERGTPIDKRSGERTIAKIHQTHGGAPAADSLLAAKAKPDGAVAKKDIKAAGYVQVFSGKGFEVKTTVKLESKSLPDLADGMMKTAFFQLELAITGGGATWMTKTRVHADPTEDPDNGNILLWTSLHVDSLAVAPDRRAVALTFSGKPYVILQPKPAAPTKK